MRNRLILLLSSAALLAAVMLIPSAASAATCPPGQEGTPPYCKDVPPTIDVETVKVTPGTSTVTLNVSAPGTVKVSGKGVKPSSIKVSAAGDVKVKVALTPAEKKLLNKKGKVTLKVTITYTPTGGSPITKTVKIVVKKKGKK
jgi:hypothetical protein